MPESHFYSKAMAGMPALVGQWLMLGEATPDQLAVILADTARVTQLGQPEADPNGETLTAWSRGHQPPQWASKAALFLLAQMPQHPSPRSQEETAAWAYTWLRLRDFSDIESARDALPFHLREPLDEALSEAWMDMRAQRLI
ncbi:hypothetical protein [Phytohalomonas tamaricis]|uniref:hypothetical protein n=1 Tax=Phytohalomonas tamaricis TaxID=2081032 RepID=UPI000D0AC5BD|nr:hypothetical protein [Phytohalomonas tamaricis]